MVRPRGNDRSLAAFLVSPRGARAALGLALATMVVFRLAPGLDLAAAGAFYAGHNHFVGETAAGAALRRVSSLIPFLVTAALCALYVLRRLDRAKHEPLIRHRALIEMEFEPNRSGIVTRVDPGKNWVARLWAPSGRGLLFVLVTLALGPGLLVNGILKDHSHRPRPVQTDRFGGPFTFRPVGDFDGACAVNCSFVSGEGATAFWTVAPALLAPPALQPIALGGALGFGLASSLLRIAFGGHYLSDTIMAALFIWLVVAASWSILMRPARTEL